jgi:hypothetical protein
LNQLTEKLTKFETVSLFVAAASPRISRFAIAVTTPKQKTLRRFIMSKIDVEFNIEEALQSKNQVFVMFSALWCCALCK